MMNKNKNKLIIGMTFIVVIFVMFHLNTNSVKKTPVIKESFDTSSDKSRHIFSGKFVNGKFCFDLGFMLNDPTTDNTETYYTVTAINLLSSNSIMLLTNECCPSQKNFPKNLTIDLSLNVSNCDGPDTMTNTITNATTSFYVCNNESQLQQTIKSLTIGNINIPVNETFIENVNFVEDTVDETFPLETGFNLGSPLYNYLNSIWEIDNYTLNIGNARLLLNDIISEQYLPIVFDCTWSYGGPSMQVTNINGISFIDKPLDFMVNTCSDTFMTYSKNIDTKNAFSSDNFNLAKPFYIIINNKIKVYFPANVRYNKNSEMPVYDNTVEENIVDQLSKIKQNNYQSNINEFGLGFLSNVVFNFDMLNTQSGINNVTIAGVSPNSNVIISNVSNASSVANSSGEVTKTTTITATASKGGGLTTYNRFQAALAMLVILVFSIAIIIVVFIVFRIFIESLLGPFFSAYKHKKP